MKNGEHKWLALPAVTYLGGAVHIPTRTRVRITVNNELVRARRLELGLSKTAVARRMGTPRTCYWNIESGDRESLMPLEYEALCKALEIEDDK